MYRFEEANECFRKALENVGTAKNRDAARSTIYVNWASLKASEGAWSECMALAKKALEFNPDSPKGKANLGLAYLALGYWKEGWPLYDNLIGLDKSRKLIKYKDEKFWDGTPGKTVVIYPEQGLGDEISFASMIPDAIETNAKTIIECEPRLTALFKRSFPRAEVHGTRWNEGVDWTAQQIDYSCPSGALGKHFRPTQESCPGTPYLVPDPEQVTMWSALFREKGKPVIGVAWSGGVSWTGDRNRFWTLDELLPVFKSVDATWVSLQYKDASGEISAFREKHPEIDLRQYDYGTLTDDYDTTAAIVASLDMVFSMQTAVIHLAGALGKECWCFVNKNSQWRYGPPDRKSIPWYKSVRLWRWKDGWPLKEAAQELKEKYARPAA